jgi:hypothetical protein
MSASRRLLEQMREEHFRYRETLIVFTLLEVSDQAHIGRQLPRRILLLHQFHYLRRLQRSVVGQ